MVSSWFGIGGHRCAARRVTAAAVLVLVVIAVASQPVAWGAAAKEALPAKSVKEVKDAKECKDEELIRRSTAVTLNYCRASFYRIQKNPTLRVLAEEQEKILNNVDLNGIADQEVVKLYTGVLVEISEIRLSDRERIVLQDKYHNTLGTLLTADAFDFGTQLASARYLSAVRTGARSWWDYRNTSTIRDVEVFHVDQKRLMAFTEKSGQFLDTFWKLARDRKIPDRWLIRNQDLCKLELAMREHDPLVRLRVLRRMEEFMTCFPPYWYYVARTQQTLGQLKPAAATYEKLLKVGLGHFRKDDMLAAGLANWAMIQDYLHQQAAVDTALKSLACSTDVWEANLMAAQVLGRNGRSAEAEDAILRNLDVDLERDRSTVALISLYSTTHNTARLQAWLTNPQTVARLPMPTLIRAAAMLGPRRVPQAVMAHWAATVAARYDLNFGADDFVLVTTPMWRLQSSEMSLMIGADASRQSTIALQPGKSEVRFGHVGEVGHPFYASNNPPPAVLLVKFPDAPLVRLRLDSRLPAAGNGSNLPVVDMLAGGSFNGRRQPLSLASVEIGEADFPVAASLRGATVPQIDESETAPNQATAGDAQTAKAAQGAAAARATTSTATPATAPPTITTPQTAPATSNKTTSAESSAAVPARSQAVPQPPIPLLTFPRFAFPRTDNTSGPALPSPQGPIEGPRFAS